MNKDLFRYKLYFISIILVIGYAYMHTHLTGIYGEVPLDKWINFKVPLPFGQRFLVPILANIIIMLTPLSTAESFFILECLFVGLFLYGMVSLLKTSFTQEQSLLLGWLFIILLPLATIINYPLTNLQVANLFYPYDSASLLFMVVGLLLCLKSRWGLLSGWIFIATFNRETSVLLVLLIPSLHWQNINKVLKPLGMAILAYLAGRFIVYQFSHHLPGFWMEFYATSECKMTNLEANLNWLLDRKYILIFLFEFACLPLFWFAYYDYIPQRFRPLRYLIFAYFVGLLFVAKIAESRVLSEVVVFLYFPVCLAIKAWLAGEEPVRLNSSKGILYYADRYAIIGMLILIVLLQNFFLFIVK